MICPFLKSECVEDCALFNKANDNCSIFLMAEIEAMRTKGFRTANDILEPIPVRMVRNND